MTYIDMERVGGDVVVKIGEDRAEQPLTIVFAADVASEFGLKLVQMASFLAHDSLDDVDELLQEGTP